MLLQQRGLPVKYGELFIHFNKYEFFTNTKLTLQGQTIIYLIPIYLKSKELSFHNLNLSNSKNNDIHKNV